MSGCRRDTAYGVFNLAVGAALLVASIIAGSPRSAFGHLLTFYAGTPFSCAALAGLLMDARKTAV